MNRLSRSRLNPDPGPRFALALRPADWSVRRKLTVAVTLLVIAAVTVVTTLSIQRERATFRSELNQQADAILHALAASWENDIIRLNIDSLDDAIDAIPDAAGLQELRAYDAQGRVIADLHSEHGNLGVNPDAWGAVLVAQRGVTRQWTDDGLQVGKAISIGGRSLGAISLDLSTDALAGKTAAAAQRAILAGGLIVALAIATAWALGRSITEPLRTLTQAAGEIAAGGAAQDIALDRGDEVGALSRSFDEMVRQLQRNLATVEAERVRFESIAASISTGLLLLDAEGDVSYVNRSLSLLTGLAEQELLGSPIARVTEALGIARDFAEQDEELATAAGRASRPPSTCGWGSACWRCGASRSGARASTAGSPSLT